ncbi:SPOSA6832_01162, partial [Sporobolomyces salmonicolor]
MTKGETFSSTVFGVFGGFYFSYAAILTPAFGVAAAFANDAAGLNNALAIFLFVFNGFSAFICIFLASLRTNICLVVLFFGVVMGGGGAFLFISSCSGFYLVLVQIFESVDMPFVLPVGDLARHWPKKKRL